MVQKPASFQNGAVSIGLHEDKKMVPEFRWLLVIRLMWWSLANIHPQSSIHVLKFRLRSVTTSTEFYFNITILDMLIYIMAMSFLCSTQMVNPFCMLRASISLHGEACCACCQDWVDASQICPTTPGALWAQPLAWPNSSLCKELNLICVWPN